MSSEGRAETRIGDAETGVVGKRFFTSFPRPCFDGVDKFLDDAGLLSESGRMRSEADFLWPLPLHQLYILCGSDDVAVDMFAAAYKTVHLERKMVSRLRVEQTVEVRIALSVDDSPHHQFHHGVGQLARNRADVSLGRISKFRCAQDNDTETCDGRITGRGAMASGLAAIASNGVAGLGGVCLGTSASLLSTWRGLGTPRCCTMQTVPLTRQGMVSSGWLLGGANIFCFLRYYSSDKYRISAFEAIEEVMNHDNIWVCVVLKSPSERVTGSTASIERPNGISRPGVHAIISPV